LQLFRKKDKYQPLKMPPSTTLEERKKLRSIHKKRKDNEQAVLSAQDSIPFQRMYPDGLCRVSENFYSRTVQFQDINYRLAHPDDQAEIFTEWAGFLNSFDSSVKFQLSFLNRSTDPERFRRRLELLPRSDGFDPDRREYSAMIQSKFAQGNNGLTKTKYLTFGIEAGSAKEAKSKLERIQTDVVNNFRQMGVRALPLDGKERLEVIHSMFHPESTEPFRFEWRWLPVTGMNPKDFIAPDSFTFQKAKQFQCGELHGAMSFLHITASDMSDRMLSELLDMDSSQIVTMHIQSVDQHTAIKTVKHTITELDRSKIEQQQKAVRAGYDMDILPADLATYGNDAKDLLKELQQQNERMFMLTFLVMTTGRSQQELDNNLFQAASIAQK